MELDDDGHVAREELRSSLAAAGLPEAQTTKVGHGGGAGGD